MNNLKRALQNRLSMAGFKSEIVSTNRLPHLQSEIETLISENNLQKEFYDDQLSKFKFEIPQNLPTAKSIIIVASRQPKVMVTFNFNEQKIPVVIPPTYSSEVDQEYYEIMSVFLSKHGHVLCEAVLPVKALAVHAGLAVYGKNNITYIDDWGSFFRLKAYFSDMPCPQDSWQKFAVSDICQKCKSCINQCPTRAIRQDSFLIHHERCLTYLNESVNDFPEWVDSKWHHCLIGCMVCQEVCPLNKGLKSISRDRHEFSEDETMLLLQGETKENLPIDMVLKLKKLDIFDEYIPIQRNLNALIFNNRSKTVIQKQSITN